MFRRSAENSYYSEINLDRQIERETQRVIADHVPTIYAVQGWASSEYGYPFSIATVDSVCEQAAAAPQKVEQQIRNFFAAADELIVESGARRQISPDSVERFKIFFRRLYTVATPELLIGAIESGQTTARKLVGGEENRVLYWQSAGKSGELFRHNLDSRFYNPSGVLTQPDYSLIDKRYPKVALIVDDVIHSGDQIWRSIRDARDYLPRSVSIVVSVGATTTRGLESVRKVLRSKDILIFQEKRLGLGELIATAQVSKKQKKELLKLAADFFSTQGYEVKVGLSATHIITTFKLPDRLSNGCLRSLTVQGQRVEFTPKPVSPKIHRLYPQAL